MAVEKAATFRPNTAAYEVHHAPVPTPLAFLSTPRSGKGVYPPLSYTLQNIVISLGMLVGVVGSLIATLVVALPLSVIGFFRSRTEVRRDVRGRGLYERENEIGQDTMAYGELETDRKVVLIVGASRGLGLEILREYAGEAATTVIAVSRSTESLQRGLSQIDSLRATVHTEALDISRPASEVEQTIQGYDAKYGPITHAYIVAGVTNYTDAEEQPWNVESMNNMIQVNISGTTSASMAVYDRMKERRSGKICIIGSVAGHFSPANMLGYASTKAYLNTFATSLRVLASAYNIDVVSAQPGYLDTQVTQAMRFKPQHASPIPSFMFYDPAKSAHSIKSSVEKESDTVGVVTHPTYQSAFLFMLQALNPMWEGVGRWVPMQLGVVGWNIS